MTYNIIKTDNYLLVIDDSEIKEGDYYLSKISNDVFRRSKDGHWIENYDKKMYHKVIAHLPLNNSPILEGVDLLPSLEQEDDVDKLAELNGHPESSQFYDYKEGFIDGFLEAKEKYKYTEEDMFIIRNQLVTMLPTGDISAWDMIQSISKYTKWLDEYVESLSQPGYPIGFECEMQCGRCYMPLDEKECWSARECVQGSQSYPDKTKTTTNSQGQTIWVGEYIFN